MKQTTLITGASSGIGLELSKVFAQNGFSLVLVARNVKKLNELKKEFEADFGVSVYVFEKDLTLTESAQEIYNEVKQAGIQVDILCNNAGFGFNGNFESAEYKTIEDMIELNINTLTKLCRLFLPDFLEKREGKILNVASIASFEAMPYMAVYGATKAYVLSLSEALWQETKKSGVSVTAVCPGPTSSNFMSVSTMDKAPMLKGKPLPSPQYVAKVAFEATIKGKRVAIPLLKNQLLVWLMKFMPKALCLKTTEMSLKK